MWVSSQMKLRHLGLCCRRVDRWSVGDVEVHGQRRLSEDGRAADEHHSQPQGGNQSDPSKKSFNP